MTALATTWPVRRLVATSVTAALWSGLAVLLVQQARQAARHGSAGLDFWPLRHAAQDLLRHDSVYSDPLFVYPPSAAVAFLPLTVGGDQGALEVWIAVLAMSVVLACVLVARGAGLPYWPACAAALAAGLLTTDAATHALWLANLSLLLAPAAVGAVLLYERGRWTAGTAVLTATVLVKPLLAPLLLLPLLERQWRAVAVCGAAGIAALSLAVVWVPGGDRFPAVLRHLAGGSILRDADAVYNLSFRGLAERLDAPVLGYAGSVVVLIVALSAVVLSRRQAPRPGDTAALAAVILVGVFLAGSLSEVHFLLVALPLSVLAAALSRRRVTAAALLAALAIGVTPRQHLGPLVTSDQALQLRYVLLECLLLLAACTVLVRSTRRAHLDEHGRDSSPALAFPGRVDRGR